VADQNPFALFGALLGILLLACGGDSVQPAGSTSNEGPSDRIGSPGSGVGVDDDRVATDPTGVTGSDTRTDDGQGGAAAEDPNDPLGGLIVFQSTRDNAPGPFCGTLECSDCPPWGTTRTAADPVCQSRNLGCAYSPRRSYDCSRCEICGGHLHDGYWACELCDRTPTDEIYLMNEDATAQTRLTSNGFFDTQPDLSGDGTRIVFVSDRDGNDELYSMKIDGSEVTRLTSTPDAREGSPDWSSTGAIVFVSNRDGNSEIYRMNGDGSAVTRLTTSPAEDHSPMFSPDGTRIVFVSDRDGNAELYAMNSDGSAVTRLTDTTQAEERAPAFVDDQRIIFISDRDGDFDVYTADAANGRAVTRLTTTPAIEVSAVRVPDGRVVVTSDQDGSYQLYSMELDGSGVTRLTNNAGADRWPRAALGKPQGLY
jgi:hypothetical protein